MSKKIVITQSALHFLSGSEVATLELAEYFTNIGWEVIVFTWFLSDPIKREFEKKKIIVSTDKDDDRLKGADYVWVHHQVVPKIILKNINANRKKPQFIFFHMSATETIYLEQPYVFELEKNISTKSLFVSEEALNAITKKYPSIASRAEILSNWVPESFKKFTYDSTRNLKKILVVSNHPPKEVLNFKTLAEKAGLAIEFIGGEEKKCLVTPEIINDADVVVTIGKTVQYCLSMGLPVFVYDHFGGPGYLTAKNYSRAKKYNFSGRSFEKFTAREILEKIQSGFEEAKVYQNKNLVSFREEFGMNEKLTRLFSDLKTRERPEISSEFINSAEAVLGLVRERVVADNSLVLEKMRNAQERDKYARDIDSYIRDRDNYRQAYENLKNSKTIRIADKAKRLVRFSPAQKDNHSIDIPNYKRLETRNKIHNPQIVGILLERNESLLLKDTLDEMSKIVDAIIVVDDASTDKSVNIALANQKTILVLKNKRWLNVNDRSAVEGQHRQSALTEAKKLNPKWILCLDADERIENPKKVREYMLKNADNDAVSGLRFSLFDAYMTKNDSTPYTGGALYGFRKMFGRERRDIPMAWKNSDQVNFPLDGNAARVPLGLLDDNLVTKFYVQHYGKSLSVDHWEETCDFYATHFPEYAEKWKARKGKAVHDDKSDFGTKLMSWEDVKKDGGILIS